MSKVNINKMLAFDEGRVLRAYHDSKKILSCGIGHNLVANPCRDILKRKLVLNSPITSAECELLYKHDLDEVVRGLTRWIDNFEEMDEKFRVVLINMCFNMGLPRLSKFKLMIAAMEKGDTRTAIKELIDSDYYNELTTRATRMVNILQGIIPKEYV